MLDGKYKRVIITIDVEDLPDNYEGMSDELEACVCAF